VDIDKANQPGCGSLSRRTRRRDQAAASFNFFSGRTLTLTDAGFAAKTCSTLVNGLMPLRFG